MKNSILITIFAMLCLPAFAQYSGGNGTETSPYLISSNADMISLANVVNNGTTYAGVYFRLTQDLTDENIISTTIGYNKSFNGTFDGNGYEIEINNGSGVFGNLNNATIQNLGVKGTVSGSNVISAGGICALASSSIIKNCYNMASVYIIADNSSSYAGGICGQVSGTTKISNCFNSGKVSARITAYYQGAYSGGICGGINDNDNDNVIILSCYNSGNIESTSIGSNYYTYAGGICGYGSTISLNNCFSSNNNITSQRSSTYYGYTTGRIKGESDNINNCYALSTMIINGSIVSGQNAYDKNGKGESITSFKSQNWLETNLGWDFDNVWMMSDSNSITNGLPLLKIFKKYSIAISANSGGSVSPYDTVTVRLGENLTVYFTPDSGYYVEQVLIDGVEIALAKENGYYIFSNIIANHTVSVTFAEAPVYIITASASAGGTIEPNGLIPVEHQRTKKFNFIPTTGYEITQVLIDSLENLSAKQNGYYMFTNVTSNHSINVSFKLRQFTITFNANGGGVYPLSKQIMYNDTIFTLPTPFFGSSIFLGWNTKQDGIGTYFTPQTVYNFLHDTTLYAQWIPTTHNLYFDANGGEISQISKAVTWYKPVGELPLPTNADTSYIFIAWNSAPTGGGNYYDSTTIFTATQDITLYAIWKHTQSKPDDEVFIEDNQLAQDGITIYPNPVSDVLTIKKQGKDLPTNDMSQIKIYNIYGKLVYAAKGSQSGIITINVSTLSSGVYILKTNNRTLRFVKI